MLPIIEAALNRHAGGMRRFSTTSVLIRWRARWTVHPATSGRALGVAIVNDDLCDALSRPAHPPAAQTLIVTGSDRTYARMIFRSSSFAPPRRRSIAEERLHSTVAHELGHSFGLADQRSDRGSTMYYAQLSDREYRRIDQRWSDHELQRALQGIFEGPGRIRPDWL